MKYVKNKLSTFIQIIFYKIVKVFCLKLKISLTTELIEFSF